MSGGHRGKGAGWYARLQAALNNKTPLRWLFFFLFLIAIFLTSCKSPATRAKDSTRHATVQRIETHDTIIFGAPYTNLWCGLETAPP